GEVAGGDRTNEIVLIGAHLDSWDLGTGALDDGAGGAVAIEVARLIAALPGRPRRTVRAARVANEELGGGGGGAPTRAPTRARPRVTWRRWRWIRATASPGRCGCPRVSVKPR